jgi:hypothetical protein
MRTIEEDKLLASLAPKRGGFFDLPKEKKCKDPEHEPPKYIHIPQGKGYRHFCPACGEETVIIPQQHSL